MKVDQQIVLKQKQILNQVRTDIIQELLQYVVNFISYRVCVCPFLFFSEDANSPVPVSENKTEREGSLLMIGGELRAGQVRNVSCI